MRVLSSAALVVFIAAPLSVEAFCGPQSTHNNNNNNNNNNSNNNIRSTPCIAQTAISARASRSRLNYAPKQQEEESKTKLHYLNPNRQKDFDEKSDSSSSSSSSSPSSSSRKGTDLFYASGTNLDYEKVAPPAFDLDKLMNTMQTAVTDTVTKAKDAATAAVSSGTSSSGTSSSGTSSTASTASKPFSSGVQIKNPFFFCDFQEENKLSQTSHQETATITSQLTNYQPHSALDDLPKAIGYATSLSVAGIASTVTKTAKKVASTLEEGANLSQKVEHSFADAALQIKDNDYKYQEEEKDMNMFRNMHMKMNIMNPFTTAAASSGLDQHRHHFEAGLEDMTKSTKSLLDGIGEQIRHGSKHLPIPSSNGSGHGNNDNGNGSSSSPIPELVQALIDQADKITSISSTTLLGKITNHNNKKKKKNMKITSILPPDSIATPTTKTYYTPFEACNILYQHEMDDTLDKPKAMKMMLDNEYVPVGRTQLYRLFKLFKEGKITEERKWGQRGRPSRKA